MPYIKLLESLNQPKEIIVTINRQWRLKTRPSGLIGPEHFEYVETELVDTAAERCWSEICVCHSIPLSEGGSMTWKVTCRPSRLGGDAGRNVGQVVESNHADFEPGDLVQGLGGGRISLLCLRESDYRSCQRVSPPSRRLECLAPPD